ncbi:hypothetical protein [Rothia nasimurium]|uniref:hypothetical protein n=1 Tax=Rothia nasimurium TaxID=85336 RepID=UPI001F2E43F1|nr:hypothetical protein [Rothia nasimurium]
MKQIFSIFLIAPIALLTSCGSTAQQDTSATATLDYENNVIIKPLDEYSETSYSGRIYNRLIDTMYTQCLAQKGITYNPGELTTPIGSREYGFWNTTYIKQYGYSIFEPYSGETTLTDQEHKELEACYEEKTEIKELHQYLQTVSANTSLPEKLRTEARSHAIRNPAWQKAREQWWQCLENNGLTPRTGDEEWGTKQEMEVDTSSDAGKQEAVRIALTEANCSQETGLAQTLADLEASYQAPLIKENQAALNEAKIAIQQFTQDIEQRYQATQ